MKLTQMEALLTGKTPIDFEVSRSKVKVVVTIYNFLRGRGP